MSNSGMMLPCVTTPGVPSAERSAKLPSNCTSLSIDLSLDSTGTVLILFTLLICACGVYTLIRYDMPVLGSSQ